MSPPNPIVLSPATPSELLEYIIDHHRYPTTILIGWPKETFIQGLVEDITLQHLSLHQETAEQNQQDEKEQAVNVSSSLHPLERKSLLQTAVSRHIRLLFVPSMTHLRAYLGTFSASDSQIPPPPLSDLDISDSRCPTGTPLLLVYGFLELHRGGTEWSAQGIGTTAAYFIEAAARNSFRAAMAEPRGAKGLTTLDEFLDEKIPILSGSGVNSNGEYSGRTVPIRAVLSRWFKFTRQEDRERAQTS
ncbi:uncharacterized protein TRIREDRAFT_104137 [Trichoderma reesei QM6a]|jgi:hypothetical protein|uniref:Predicted protein n=2 Tax=Hypocrea jecorina TaxID=51453 RepID=G0RBJ4_HYPJQ|nr:uncharacterized protein TRIREDRAFT_104137 [Trichoderma reesei QM6a]EGR51336.1 predicted protein [Trichoderma reesei QM6a]ETS04803.1 hypothetical protein M419DRAFT_33566 [Trichoderma reesei RUT C-30]